MPSLEVERRNEQHWANVMAMARRGINAPVEPLQTTAMAHGRSSSNLDGPPLLIVG